MKPPFGKRWGVFPPLLGFLLLSAGASPHASHTLERGSHFPSFHAFDYEWRYYSIEKDFQGSPFLIYVFDPLSSQRISLVEQQAHYLNRLPEENRKILGVAWETTWGALRDFAQRNHLLFPVVFAESDEALHNVIADVSPSLPIFLVLDSSSIYILTSPDVILVTLLLKEIQKKQWTRAQLSRLYDAHQALYSDSQFLKAIEFIRVLQRGLPSSSAVQYLYAMALHRAGNPQEALRNFFSIYTPQNDILQDYIANKLLFSFQFSWDEKNLPPSSLFTSFLQVFQERPPSLQKDPWILVQMAMLALFTQQFREAKQWMQEAYSQKPTSPGVQARLAVILLAAGEDEAGVKLLESLEAKLPADPRLFQSLMIQTFRDLFWSYQFMVREKQTPPSSLLYKLVQYAYITRRHRLVNDARNELLSRNDEYSQRFRNLLNR